MNTETQALQRVESEPEQAELPVIVPVEPKTSQQARIDEVTEALLPAYQKASELRLSDEENQALLAPFADDQVEIRPHDGLLYIPHIHISDRLIRVLGAGQWAMVRRREWIEANRIYAEYVMKVRGCFVGESVGAMDYHPSNPRMNYSDALEGTRGECIRRIAAKDLGCGSQVWNPEYCRQWVARYAEQDRKGKWQRKGQGNGQNQLAQTTQLQQQPNVSHRTSATGTAKPPGSEPGASPAVATEKTRAWFLAEMRKRFNDQTLLRWAKGRSDPSTIADFDDGIDDWPLHQVPTSKDALNAMILECADFTGVQPTPQKPAEAPSPPNTTAAPGQSAPKGQPAGKALGLNGPADEQPWFRAVVPVPYAGMKRDEYLKRPDTIGELYNLRHDDDQARRRLFGFLHNFQPKGWTNREGKQMPPSKTDLDFRDYLDAFGEWFEENHPDEVKND